MGQLLCNWFYQLQPITGKLHCKLLFFSKYSGWWKKVFCLKRFYASSTNSPQRSFWSFYFFLNLLKLAEVFGLSCFVNLHCWNYRAPTDFRPLQHIFVHFCGLPTAFMLHWQHYKVKGKCRQRSKWDSCFGNSQISLMV